jgi:hypothetical protein
LGDGKKKTGITWNAGLLLDEMESIAYKFMDLLIEDEKAG